MKILIISNLYPPYILGGYEILCAQVVQYLQERGHMVHVLTSDHKSSVCDSDVTRTLQVYQPFDKSATFMRKARLATAKHNDKETSVQIQKHQPDVIFIWSLLRLTPAPAKIAEKSGIPVVFTFNDENITSFLSHPFGLTPKKCVHWFLDKFIMPNITLDGLKFSYSTCISKILKRNIIARGLPIEASRIIYQGIPIERFPLKEGDVTVHSPIKILYAGQLHAYKGVHTVLGALGTLQTRTGVPKFSLTIVGKGPDDYTRRLHDEAAKIGPSVKFLGLVPHAEMPAIYREHDLFVFPSIWEEPFGLTHLEAMASGLPVVSTANGGQGEFLVDEENSLVFPPEDESVLANQLARLMTDRALYAKLVKNGRSTVEEHFTFSRYVDDLEDLLNRATKRT
jgi:glycogen synthase